MPKFSILDFDFKPEIILSLEYFYMLIPRLYSEFQLNIYPGTGKKVCGGVGGLMQI